LSDPIYSPGYQANFSINVLSSNGSNTKSIYYFASWKYQDNNYLGLPAGPSDVNVTVSANYTLVALRSNNSKGG